MDFLQLVKDRYSCKKFNGEPVAQEVLDQILEAGRLAPTAKNLQEQRIYVLQSPEALAKMDKVCPCRYGATTVLAIAYDKSEQFTLPGGKYTTGAEDAAIVATHMMLAAASLGVDSCWINYYNPEEAMVELGLPDHEDLLLLLDLGYKAEGAEPLPNHGKRKNIGETVKYL